jgi:UDP-N-acetyl-D-mannosaminuronic acid dehydrogenase
MMKIAVIGGAGHIGLPLSLILAKKYQVTIIDPSPNTNLIKKGIKPFTDPGIDSFLKNQTVKNNLTFVNSLNDLSKKKLFDCVIITLGTPIDEWGNPKINDLINVCFKAKEFLNKDGIIILRSTVSPGLTNKIYKLFKNKINLLFCPERIAQSKSFKELYEIPQIVGKKNKNNKLNNIIKKIFYFSPSIIYTDFLSAELSKLYCNFWRYSTFAISNQLYLISNHYKVSTNNILRILRTDYKRAEQIPTPGFAAGPCLYKDTVQIGSSFSGDFTVGSSALKLNENLVMKVAENALEKAKNKPIIILGGAFKANCDDFRDSLSFKLEKYLKRISKNKISIFDPLIKHPKTSYNLSMQDLKKSFFIVGVKHNIFKKYLKIIKKENIINIWDD